MVRSAAGPPGSPASSASRRWSQRDGIVGVPSMRRARVR